MQQPNIVLVMADQMAAAPLPCYGGQVVKAPHLQALADGGATFDAAYCNSPICAPSRFSMLSGRLPTAIGAYDNASELPASVPNHLVVNPTLNVGSAAELIALARSKPGQLSLASIGNGTSNHLSGEMLKTLTGIQVTHVPYKSAPQAVTDLMAGQTAFAFVNMPLALPHVRSGKLKALAVTGARRSAATPEFPTMQEAGVGGFVVESWYGLMAPAGTPDAVVARLHKETLAVLALPEVKEFFAKQGADVVTSTPAEFATTIRSERARWAEVIRTSGARVE
jgi:tripartite-type tricarboxylate transporter receptor subunit TctC